MEIKDSSQLNLLGIRCYSADDRNVITCWRRAQHKFITEVGISSKLVTATKAETVLLLCNADTPHPRPTFG